MAKTIFKTTEKSNFILNMTEEQYSKLASYALLTACFIPSLFTLLPEISEKFSYSMSAGGLAVSGVICMIFALIAVIKKYIGKGFMIPLCAFGAMFLWSVISLINSYDKSIALYGFSQRGEGVLAILFYFSFFVTAASIKREQARKTLIEGVIGAGLLNSALSLIQIFTGKLGQYRSISIQVKTNAASGLSQSPLFLAMVLTLSLTVTLIGALTSESKKRRICCTAFSAVFSFVMMFTYSLIGICGLVLAVIAAAVTLFLRKSPKLRLLSLLSVPLPALLAVLLANVSVIGNASSYSLHDGEELWWADSYMRISASGNYNRDVLDISNTADVYLYLNHKTFDIIEENPLVGTGPEQLIYPQLYTMGGLDEASDISDIISVNIGTFDKVYNEYLYTAATRGIPSLIALAAIIGSVLFIAFYAMKKKKSVENIELFMLTAIGALIFLIGVSNITFSPIYWAIAGAACAEIPRIKEAAVVSGNAKASKKKPAAAAEKKTPEKTEKKSAPKGEKKPAVKGENKPAAKTEKKPAEKKSKPKAEEKAEKEE